MHKIKSDRLNSRPIVRRKLFLKKSSLTQPYGKGTNTWSRPHDGWQAGSSWAIKNGKLLVRTESLSRHIDGDRYLLVVGPVHRPPLDQFIVHPWPWTSPTIIQYI